MRKLSIAAFIALGVLAGCNNAGNQSPNAGGQTPANANTAAGAANAPIPSAVSGSVTLKDPVEISQGSKLDIKLVDVSTPDVPIAAKTMDVSGNPPFNF